MTSAGHETTVRSTKESYNVPDGTHDREANRVLLRELATTLGAESWVQGVSVFPARTPESIIVELLDEHYPTERIAEAYIEVQAYTNGDFHVTYVEDRHGEEWVCRWDRHDSPEYGRDHFHAPPAARHEDGSQQSYPDSLFDVLAQIVSPWVFDRIGALWDEQG